MSDDVIWMIVFALIAIGAWTKSVIHQVIEHRRQQGQPICGCGHHFAYHDPAQQICKQRTREFSGYGSDGNWLYEIDNCDCQQYSGPMPEIDYRIVKELGNGESKET